MPLLRRPAVGLLLAALLCAAHFSTFPVVHPPLVWDMRFYTYFASRTAEGAVPYRDYFENKTPLSIVAGAALFRLGELLGIEPLTAIRVGFLLFAGFGGLLLFDVHRRLAGGRNVPGLLAALVYCGFPLLGSLPAIGVNPKTLMGLFASAAALRLAEGNFVLAGVAGALAFLDWQIGALAGLGALAGALAAREHRLRSAAGVAAGGLLGVLPFAAWLWSTGGLRPALEQTLGTLFSRGVESAHKGTLQKAAHILDTVRVGCHGHEWLFAAGILGMLVYPLWLWRRRRQATFGMAVALAVYHYGVVAFSLFDYQSYGDLYILLHSVAFFGAVVMIEAYKRAWAPLRRWRGRAIAPGRLQRLVLQAAVVMLAAFGLRPAVLRDALDLHPPTVGPGATIDDQRAVALRVFETAGSPRVAAVGAAEVLFLADRTDPIPFVYWNAVTHRFYRRSPQEGYLPALDRLLAEHAVDVLVQDRTVLHEPGDRMVASEHGDYAVVLRSVR